jgi:hypothetical protein
LYFLVVGEVLFLETEEFAGDADFDDKIIGELLVKSLVPGSALDFLTEEIGRAMFDMRETLRRSGAVIGDAANGKRPV